MVTQFMGASENQTIINIAINIQKYFDPQSVFYNVIYFLLVVGFTYFYTSVTFNPKDIETILIHQLKEFEAYISYTEKKQPVVIIPRRKIKKFLSFIGKCPINVYAYKWKVYEYKSKTLKILDEK